MIINLFCIKELNKLWKRTFSTIHQMSCFINRVLINTETPPNFAEMPQKKLHLDKIKFLELYGNASKILRKRPKKYETPQLNRV